MRSQPTLRVQCGGRQSQKAKAKQLQDVIVIQFKNNYVIIVISKNKTKGKRKFFILHTTHYVHHQAILKWCLPRCCQWWMGAWLVLSRRRQGGGREGEQEQGWRKLGTSVETHGAPTIMVSQGGGRGIVWNPSQCKTDLFQHSVVFWGDLDVCQRKGVFVSFVEWSHERFPLTLSFRHWENPSCC